jgi:hypothetical protein
VHQTLLASFAFIVSLISLAGFVNPKANAIEINSHRNGQGFITEGTLDAGDWYQQGLANISDYANYNQWALRNLDGNDPISALHWEHFQAFQFEAPDIMIILYKLNLPWPFGSSNNRARFKIDESQLINNHLFMTLIDRPPGLEAAILELFAKETEPGSGIMKVHFKMVLNFDWFIAGLIESNSFFAHLNYVVSTLALNLEAYTRSLM